MKVEQLLEKRIEKSLDLVENTPSKVVEVLNTNEITQPTVINGGEKDTDFQYARENMYDIIEKGRDAMEELLEIAKAEESPRAFEVFGQLLKNMSDSQEKLMVFHLAPRYHLHSSQLNRYQLYQIS